MPEELFTINADGWIAQHRDRPLWEVFREVLQNAMDEESDIHVEASTLNKEIVVRDFGSGFKQIEHAWQVFGGDKGDDPEKRGRFSRGLKEAVAVSDWVRVETTAGTVTFNVDAQTREVDEEATLDQGTRVTMRGSHWKQSEVREVYDYCRSIWVPEGIEIQVDVHGGKTETFTRADPVFTQRMYLKTRVLKEESGAMEDRWRHCDVHVRSAVGSTGVLYEMGIPVDREAPFPFHVDVQQRVPMAEQRNEPNSYWYNRRLKPKLIEALHEHGHLDEMTVNDLREDWIVNSLSDVSDEVQEYYVGRVVADGRKRGLAYSTTNSADDKARQAGYQVFHTERASSGIASAVKNVAPSTKEVAGDVAEKQKEQVTPTEAERETMELCERIAEMAGHDIECEMWSWEPAPGANHIVAEHKDGGTVRLNRFERNWEEINSTVIGTLIHEVAHEEGRGHDPDWHDEMQRIAGILAMKAFDAGEI